MIVWLNGTFGVGKSTTARQMRQLAPEWRLFDPEHVGYLLSSQLPDLEFDDFQDLPPWRRLVPQVAREIVSLTESDLIAVQSVLVERYWRELARGMAEVELPLVHVVLDADPDTLIARIRADEEERSAEQWRLEHVEEYRDARGWMFDAADLVVDTTGLEPADVAARVLAGLG